MSYEVKKSAPCKECGEPTYRRERNTRDALCVVCAIKKMNAHNIQMSNHSGPHYDAWLDSMLVFLRRQGRTRGDSYTKHDQAFGDTR